MVTVLGEMLVLVRGVSTPLHAITFFFDISENLQENPKFKDRILKNRTNFRWGN